MTAGNKAPDSGVASLCSRKRKQTLEGPLPLVADPLATTTSQDTRVKKKRGGRPREAKYSSFLRDIDSLTHSEFCRMVVLSTTMVEALSDDERYVIQNLHKMGQRLNQLFVQGKLNSHVNAQAAEYTAFMADFAEIKAYYQKKVRRL